MLTLLTTHKILALSLTAHDIRYGSTNRRDKEVTWEEEDWEPPLELLD